MAAEKETPGRAGVECYRKLVVVASFFEFGSRAAAGPMCPSLLLVSSTDCISQTKLEIKARGEGGAGESLDVQVSVAERSINPAVGRGVREEGGIAWRAVKDLWQL